MIQYPTIYGLDARWLNWDRLYKIYVATDCLCGAYIAGQVYDQDSATANLQNFCLLFRRSVNRSFQRREDREARYEGMDPTSREFLAQDNRNFHIRRREVIDITVNRRRSLWTPNNIGIVNIELRDGKLRRFILVGDQDADAIAKTLRLFHPETTAVGESSRLPKKREPRRLDWIRSAFMSAVFLGFAILFICLALLGVQHLGYLAIGALNFCAAIYYLRLVRKYRALPTEREEGV